VALPPSPKDKPSVSAKFEADQSNPDASLSARVNVLERRMLEIEIRPGKTL